MLGDIDGEIDADGDTDGLIEGERLGLFDGLILGETDSDIDGEIEGLIDSLGDTEGLIDGEILGDKDGDKLGENEGEIEGLILGEIDTEGDKDGLKEALGLMEGEMLGEVEPVANTHPVFPPPSTLPAEVREFQVAPPAAVESVIVQYVTVLVPPESLKVAAFPAESEDMFIV